MSKLGIAVEQGNPIDEDLARRDYILKLLAKLSQDDRNLLILKEVEGHSVEELAGMTGMNENTIKVKLFRARQKLLFEGVDRALAEFAKKEGIPFDTPWRSLTRAQQERLLNARGLPAFNVMFYVLSRSGACAGAALGAALDPAP